MVGAPLEATFNVSFLESLPYIIYSSTCTGAVTKLESEINRHLNLPQVEIVAGDCLVMY